MAEKKWWNCRYKSWVWMVCVWGACLLWGVACQALPATVPPTPATPPPLAALPLTGQAHTAVTWPALPDDLFFLREGQLWHWPAGAEPVSLVKVLDSAVKDYRVTPDGQTIAYLTRAGKLGTVNRRTGDQVRVTLPNRRPFVGFALAPDGSRLAVSDADGLWMIALPSGEVTQLLGNPPSESGVTTWLPQSWSPDGRWLLAHLAAADEYPLYAIDVQVRRYRQIQDGCLGEVPHAAWSATGLWLSTSRCGEGGALVLLQPSGRPDWEVLRRSPATAQLLPSAWQALAGERLAFAQYDLGSGPSAGLYFLDAEGALVPVLTAACIADAAGDCMAVEWGLATWAADARAFVLPGLTGELLIGDLQAGVLWDLRELLRGATNFQWGLPLSGQR